MVHRYLWVREKEGSWCIGWNSCIRARHSSSLASSNEYVPVSQGRRREMVHRVELVHPSPSLLQSRHVQHPKQENKAFFKILVYMQSRKDISLNILGLHWILIVLDIRQIFLPDIRLNSNLDFFFLFFSRKNVASFSFQQILLRICYILI